MSTDERTERQAEMLANRLRKNQRRLRSWARRESIGCYRLYDRDIPELPLVVDWYEGRLHVAEFARAGSPGEEDEASHEAWLAALVGRAAAALDVAPENVFLKRRERQRGLRQYERFSGVGARYVVREGGLSFIVNLSDYLDTGLFLDHRTTRQLVRAEAQGRRFLNLFAYTGAFTVHAAAGGASATTSVDLSATYLDWAGENLRLNGFSGREHRLVQADVLTFLEEEAQSGRRYDLVMLDPPTFSNSKRMRGVLDIQRHHPLLLEGALGVTAAGGLVFFSTNFRKFHIQIDRLDRVAQCEEITAQTIPPDFRDRKVHRCWRIVRAT